MISWMIHIDGREPPEWDQARDGCWFCDFHQQEYLLPYFDVGDAQIDPYGGTEFSTADTRRLRDRLAAIRGYLEAKPDEWSVTEKNAAMSNTITLHRDPMLEVIDETLRMCEQAISTNGGLAFGGD